MAESLTVLYTQHLRGNFILAAHLGRWLQVLRSQFASEMRVLLLDLGDASDPQSWHHRLTAGRSTLFILDAMGYHAINAEGTIDTEITPAIRAGFRLSILSPDCDCLDERGPGSIRCTVAHGAKLAAGEALGIQLNAAQQTVLDAGFLRLAEVPAAAVGRVQLRLQSHSAAIVERETHPLPEHIQPEPSIAATVDFVLSEARQLTQRRDVPRPEIPAGNS